MALKKYRILPDQYIVKQGDPGETAFLVVSGGLVAEVDGQKVGKIEAGEIFGELSLILNESRKASIKAVVPSEIVEIKRKALEASATFKKFFPVPPKTSFAKMTPKIIPKATCHKGIVAGRVRG